MGLHECHDIDLSSTDVSGHGRWCSLVNFLYCTGGVRWYGQGDSGAGGMGGDKNHKTF